MKKKKNPALTVLEKKLINSVDTESSTEEKIVSLWSLLEKNETGKNLYPDEIAQYVVSEFISLGDEEDAQKVFNKYMQAQYGKENEKFVPAEHPEMISLWQCEDSAWFSAFNGENSNCRRLYEFIIEKFSEKSPIINSSGENEAVVNSYINLASIYTDYGDTKKALEYLNNASSRLTESNKKAEVLYRMAEIYNVIDDKNSAVRSLKYALSLNPSLYKAQLLLKKLK